jgi:hypothetical protein
MVVDSTAPVFGYIGGMEKQIGVHNLLSVSCCCCLCYVHESMHLQQIATAAVVLLL